MIDLCILKEVSAKLKKHNITWGIGGSCLLTLHDLYSKPNDLDLWVQPSDMQNVRNIFSDYEELSSNIPLPRELHYKILYNKVEVDFVACFIVKPNQHEFKYNILPDNIHMITVGDIDVPCTYLEDWFIIYRLLRRDDKAQLIQNYFRSQKIEFNEAAIERAIKNENISLPHRIIVDVDKLIFDATQYSLQLSQEKEDT